MSDAARKSLKRAAERDLRIPLIKEPQRRRDCLADVYQFLPTYFPDVFYQPFTADRREMLDAILHAATFGGDQAIAGPRADGKTRSALFGAFFETLNGRVSFPLIISKSGPRANRELKNLKEAIRDSKRFAEDFPELATPILALGGWSSRARQQTVYGAHTNMEWGEQELIFPTVPTELLRANGWHDDIESVARGQIIGSLGIEGPIRGYCIRSRRPDLALLDDIDDRESARSELQTDNRESIIEQDVGGLAGPDKTIARVMLCTLINQTCIAATFTGPTKPSWRGQRHKLLTKLPERTDLWDEYVQRRQMRGSDDPDARAAHRFYLDHREAMDAGAECTNPYRYDQRILLDGEPAEVSALQACYNLIADRGWDHFNCEYQNDPPQDRATESAISATLIQKKLSGYARKVIPPDCIKLTRGIDCKKSGLHWVVRAWRADGTPFTIDYGFAETYGTTYGSDEGLDLALKRTILNYLESSRDEYYTTGGEIKQIDRTLIDAGWRTDAVYAACAEAGLGVQPIMGHPNFKGLPRNTLDRRTGDGWEMTRKAGLWLVLSDAPRWKAFEHDRWLTAAGHPGCGTIFGELNPNPSHWSVDEKFHHNYARHITAELEVEEPTPKGMKRYWKIKRDNNHFLDASCYASVAASIEGIRLHSQTVSSVSKPLKLSELQAARRSQRKA